MHGCARLLLVMLSLLLLPLASLGRSLNMGMLELPQEEGGVTTVFYPATAPETLFRRGPFELSWAAEAPAVRGNGRLVVISHGSGGSPWDQTDLARVLVQRGFIVAVPQHHGDNYQDHSESGPVSWVLRPREVSRAIDALAADARLGGLFSAQAVGVLGGSAGGHTALTLAGGLWSFSRFRDHCERHIEEDFSSCVGFATRLHGNWLDGPKLWLARRIIAARFSDETVQQYFDPRIRAAVALVPFAADYFAESLATPRIPLGLVIAAQDVNQVPAFHVDRIRRACEPRCEIIMELADAGHGVMLSPMPPLPPDSLAARLLADPAGFDRARLVPELHRRIADFLVRTLAAEP